MKFSNKNIGLLSLIIIIIIILVFLVVKYALNKNEPAPNLPTKTHTPIPASVTNPDTSTPSNTPTIPDGKLVEKIVADENIILVSAFKNKNSFIYARKTDNKIELCGSNIDENNNVSSFIIFDSIRINNTDDEILSLFTANVYNLFVYDIKKGSKIKTYVFDINSLNKELVFSRKLDEPITSPIFNSLDDSLIFAQHFSDTQTIAIKSISLETKEIKQLSTWEDFSNPLEWISISSDGSVFLYPREKISSGEKLLLTNNINGNEENVIHKDTTLYGISDFSKDGSKIFYIFSNNIHLVWAKDLKGHRVISVFGSKDKIDSLSWSYYNNKIMFVSKNDLYICNRSL